MGVPAPSSSHCRPARLDQPWFLPIVSFGAAVLEFAGDPAEAALQPSCRVHRKNPNGARLGAASGDSPERELSAFPASKVRAGPSARGQAGQAKRRSRPDGGQAPKDGSLSSAVHCADPQMKTSRLVCFGDQRRRSPGAFRVPDTSLELAPAEPSRTVDFLRLENSRQQEPILSKSLPASSSQLSDAWLSRSGRELRQPLQRNFTSQIPLVSEYAA